MRNGQIRQTIKIVNIFDYYKLLQMLKLNQDYFRNLSKLIEKYIEDTDSLNFSVKGNSESVPLLPHIPLLLTHVR